MNAEHPEYLTDRFPVPPVALAVNDRILVIHTENGPDRAVNWWVLERQEKRENGKAVVTVTYRDCDAEADEEAEPPTHDFTDPQQWLSVARPIRRHARATQAAA